MFECFGDALPVAFGESSADALSRNLPPSRVGLRGLLEAKPI